MLILMLIVVLQMVELSRRLSVFVTLVPTIHQAMRQVFRVMGGSKLLGSPVGLLSNIGAGIKVGVAVRSHSVPVPVPYDPSRPPPPKQTN